MLDFSINNIRANRIKKRWYLRIVVFINSYLNYFESNIHYWLKVLKEDSKHRAVSSIIATILMISIGVVGGTMFFVAGTSVLSDDVIPETSYDSLKIVGYNAADLQDGFVNGDLVNCSSLSNNKLASDECFTIVVSNQGNFPSIIEKIRVYDTTYEFSSISAPGKFFIIDSEGNIISVIKPNEKVNICINYDGSGINYGNYIPIELESGNGQVFSANIINGDSRGQSTVSQCSTVPGVDDDLGSGDSGDGGDGGDSGDGGDGGDSGDGGDGGDSGDGGDGGDSGDGGDDGGLEFPRMICHVNAITQDVVSLVVNNQSQYDAHVGIHDGVNGAGPDYDGACDEEKSDNGNN